MPLHARGGRVTPADCLRPDRWREVAADLKRGEAVVRSLRKGPVPFRLPYGIQRVSDPFPLGRLIMTANAARRLTPREMHDALRRHESGDWGDLCPEDRDQNERALQYGSRLFSARVHAGRRQ